jgi:hypothetical protein
MYCGSSFKAWLLLFASGRSGALAIFPSGAKAQFPLFEFIGTTEVVPFQN